MYSFDSQKEIGSSATCTATGDKLTFTPAVSVEIISWGFIVTTAFSGTPMVATCDKRITAGSDTGRVTGTASAGYGIMTLVASNMTAATAGKVMRCQPVAATTVDQLLRCNPGQQAVINVGTAAGTTGIALPYIEFKVAPIAYATTEISVSA